RRMRSLIRAFITNIPFLGRYRILRASDIARLQEHNQLLTEVATESARKLQERGTEFAKFATESALKFQELQEHNGLLTEAATESARKLQEREAELTNTITVMSCRLMRLTEHNRWLTEPMMDGAGTEHTLLSGAVIQRLQEMEESIQANETKPHVDRVRLQRPTPICVSIDHAAARHRNLQGRDRPSRYLSKQKRVLMIAPVLARG